MEITYNHTEAFNDKWIVEEIFNNKTDLYYVECGAVDGIRNSTCYTLEKYLNWKGICVEANPNNFDKLKKNRTAICVSSPLDEVSDKEVDYIITKSEWLCGIKEYTLSDPIKLQKFPDAYHINNTIKIKTISLYDMLKNYNAPKIIHYLSMDIEGAEYNVLKNFPFDEYIILALTIEAPNLKKDWIKKFPKTTFTEKNEFNTKEDLPIYKLLLEKGYDCVNNKYNKGAVNEYYFLLKNYKTYI